jgi:methionyl-tRNA formyltransferase
MNNKINIIFFGSTADSVIVCDALHHHSEKLGITIRAVVTQPPKPVGRKQVITPTPVEMWAKTHTVTCLTFETQKDKPWRYEDEGKVTETLSTELPDLVISASYGQKIPEVLIDKARFGGINVHPSLLPRWRGTDPIPWTILAGDAQTGVTIVTLSKKFDVGKILAQQKIPVPQTETPEKIRTRLFTLGATLLVDILPDYCAGKHMGNPQNEAHATYARRLSKDDGYIPWNTVVDAMQGNPIEKHAYPGILSTTNTHLPEAISRAVRALSPWPGVWSIISMNNEEGIMNKNMEKRIKILGVHISNDTLVIDTVQLEGKKPTPFTAFADAYGQTLDNTKT